MGLKEVIEKLFLGHDLTPFECEAAVDEMIKEPQPSQVGAFLALMRVKGETAGEIYAIVKAFQKTMIAIEADRDVLDIVGTGGDQSHSFNISTGASILSAACGVKVAKHGNRSVSSKCGSSDVLEALGIPIRVDPEKVRKGLKVIGFAFLFAPDYHQAFKKLLTLRRDLGVSTLFNFLGPLLNPIRPRYHLIGVAKEKMVDLFADVVLKMQTKRTWIFHGNGLDELTPIGPCMVLEVFKNKKKRFIFDPKEFGFKRCEKKDLEGGDPQFNAKELLKALRGKESPLSDSLILNAGCALYVFGKVKNLQEGMKIARQTQREKKGLMILKRWKEL